MGFPQRLAMGNVRFKWDMCAFPAEQGTAHVIITIALSGIVILCTGNQFLVGLFLNFFHATSSNRMCELG